MSAAGRFFMCLPEIYGIEYVISPWIRGNDHRIFAMRVRVQWDRAKSENDTTEDSE